MKFNYLLILTGFNFLNFFLHSQTSYQWQPTSAVPSYRFEDCYFLNKDTGFAVTYPNDSRIIRTVDGGNTWTHLLDSSMLKFRDVSFADATFGCVGLLGRTMSGADTNILMQTTDFGVTWTGATSFPGPTVAGICGMFRVNDSTVYGTGRYGGQAALYKTTNKGNSWSYTDLTPYAKGLVDLYSFNSDTGFVVGFTGQNYNIGNAIILKTTDGGLNWTTAFTCPYTNTLCWKIVFPSRYVGYVSMEQFNTSANQHFLKTTDGGNNWSAIQYNGGPSNNYDVQGIGFLNDTVGWVGGEYPSYFTSDGGISWTPDSSMGGFNRFRKINDTLAYAAGAYIYKLKVSNVVGVKETFNYKINRMFPNPASDFLRFEFFMEKPGKASLSVYDLNGKLIANIFDQPFTEGNQNYILRTGNYKPGLYIAKLLFANTEISRKFQVIK